MRWLLSGTLSLICTFSALAQSKDVEAIKNLNAAWLNSYPSRDTTTLGKILAPDFLLVSPNGTTMTRKDVLNNLLSKDVETLSVTIDSVDVRLFNEVGVLNSKTTFVLKMNNKEMTGKNTYMDVYVKRNGRWSVVAAHVTLLSLQ